MTVFKYGFRIELCGTCTRHEIIWAKTKNGKAIPVDVEPHPLRGNIELVREGGIVRANIVKPTLDKTDLRLSHFATCPMAHKWRK